MAGIDQVGEKGSPKSFFISLLDPFLKCGTLGQLVPGRVNDGIL